MTAVTTTATATATANDPAHGTFSLGLSATDHLNKHTAGAQKTKNTKNKQHTAGAHDTSVAPGGTSSEAGWHLRYAKHMALKPRLQLKHDSVWVLGSGQRPCPAIGESEKPTSTTSKAQRRKEGRGTKPSRRSWACAPHPGPPPPPPRGLRVGGLAGLLLTATTAPS